MVEQAGLILTFYCVRYPHVMPYLKNNIPYSVLGLTGEGWRGSVLEGGSVPNVLNLEKLGMKIHIRALLLDFPIVF